MKWMKLLLFISIIIFSCHKPDEEPQLIVSKTKVKKGEMVTATVINQPAGTTVAWYGSNNEEMLSASSDGKMAKVFFIRGNEAEYTLRAGFYKIGGDSMNPSISYISKNIEIENDYFKYPDNLPGAVQPVPVDFLALCPILMADSSLALVFYCIPNDGDFNSYLVIRDVNISNGNIKATINQIWKPTPHETERSPADGELFTKHVYRDGRYSIELNYGYKTYQIPFEVSNNATRYTFQKSNPSFITLRTIGRDFYFSYLNGDLSAAVYTVNKF